jgi:hypothetical protein
LYFFLFFHENVFFSFGAIRFATWALRANKYAKLQGNCHEDWQSTFLRESGLHALGPDDVITNKTTI